jgi:hypothetical protein
MAAAPGPWASGYQFPADATLGDVGNAAGTAPPAPAPGAPDPSAAGAPPPGPPPTLAANTQVGQPGAPDQGGPPGPPGQPPPYLGTGAFGPAFQQYLQLTQGAYAPAKRPYLPESTKPGFLANLFTMGMAGLADRDYRTAYNAGIDRFNAGLDAKAAHDAMDLTGKDAEQRMRVMSYQQEALWKQYEMMRQFYLDQQTQKGFRYKMTSGPPKSEGEEVGQTEYGGQTGLIRVPSTEFPGRYEWVSPGSRGVPSDSPLGQQYQQGGGGGGAGGGLGGGGGGQPPPSGKPQEPWQPGAQFGGGAPPARPAQTGPPPSVTPPAPSGAPAPPSGTQPPSRPKPQSFAQLRQQQLEDKNKAAADAVQQKAEREAQVEAKQNGDKIRQYLNDDMWNQSLSVLPSAKTPIAATLKAHANKLWFMAHGEAGDDRIEYLKQGASNIIPQIKAYAASKGVRITMPEIEMYGPQWMRLAEGSMTQEHAQAFKRQVLHRLQQIDDAAAGMTPSTTSTPTSTGTMTPSSTPGAAPRTANEFLRKHAIALP